MDLFSFRIVVHYSHTIGGETWTGSTATNAQEMWIAAATIGDAESKLLNTGLVPSVGERWGMTGTVTAVDFNITLEVPFAVRTF